MLQNRSASGAAGRTRPCPHCKAVILESAAICPQCRHHLKFGAAARPAAETPRFSALNVEGTLRHAERGGDWEYSVVLSIRNERGEEISRQVVGVGALRPAEARTFTLSVEVATPGGR
jgi:acetyl-CoA carboxylase beta subunit